MDRKPFNIDAAVHELREETARPEAKEVARKAFVPPVPHSRFPAWALAFAAVALGVLVLPLAAHSPSAVSSAESRLQKVIEASNDAPIVHEVMYTMKDGKRRVLIERWAAGKRYAMHHDMPRLNIVEFRRDGDRFYTRHSAKATQFGLKAAFDYEEISTIRERVEWAGISNGLSMDDLLKSAKQSGQTVTEGEVTGGKLRHFHVSAAKGAGTSGVDVEVDVTTSRVLHIKFPSGETTFEYPTSVEESRIAIPPKSSIRRYDTEEIAEALRKQSGLASHVRQMGAGQTHLMAVVQDPYRFVWVVYEGPFPSDAQPKPARLMGYKPQIGFNTMRRREPSVNANSTHVDKELKTATVQVPVYATPKQFVGYAVFKNVPVIQVSDVSTLYRLIKR